MRDSRQNDNLKAKIKQCWHARIFGILGLFVTVWLWTYSIEAFLKDPKAIPIVILIGLMIIGWILDCVRFGREGLGGLIVILSGMVFYLFLLFDIIILKQSYSQGQTAALAGTLILFLSGILFYLCGRRRNNLKKMTRGFKG